MSTDDLAVDRLPGILAAARYVGRPRLPRWVVTFAWIFGAEVVQ